MKSLPGLAAKVRSWALGKPEIAHVSLLGSRVRGTNRHGSPARADSDLDIAIELDLVMGSKASAKPMAYRTGQILAIEVKLPWLPSDDVSA